jgi:hypothetical protein
MVGRLPVTAARGDLSGSPRAFLRLLITAKAMSHVVRRSGKSALPVISQDISFAGINSPNLLKPRKN